MPVSKKISVDDGVKSGKLVELGVGLSITKDVMEEVVDCLRINEIVYASYNIMKSDETYPTVYASRFLPGLYVTKRNVKPINWYLSNFCGGLEVTKFFRKRTDAISVLNKLPSFAKSLGYDYFSKRGDRRSGGLNSHYDAIDDSNFSIMFFNKELMDDVKEFLTDLKQHVDSSKLDAEKQLGKIFPGKVIQKVKTDSDKEFKFSVKGKKKSLFLSILKDGTTKYGSLRFDGGVLSDADLDSFNKFLDESKNG